MSASRTTGDAPARGERFLRNVVWSGTGFLAMFISGFFLSPYMIRKIGAEDYGVWAMVFAVVEYFWLFDLGLRSATLKYSAHFLALGDEQKINETINSSLAWFAVLSLLLLAGTVAFSGPLPGWLRVPPARREAFSFVFLLLGASLSAGLLFNVFKAALEAFQCYPVLNHIGIAMTAIRVSGCVLVLSLGHGLRALGAVVFIAQAAGYLMIFLALRREFPALRFSRSLVRRDTFRILIAYGLPTLMATVAGQVLVQGPTLMIGYLRSAVAVAFYNIPARLLTSTVEAVLQVSQVSSASSADLAGREAFGPIERLGVYVNRYCLALFLPVAIMVWTFGADLLFVWVGPEFAKESAAVFSVLAVGVAFGTASQQNSNSILFGVGAHKRYAQGMVAEALLLVAGMLYAIPRHGILGCAYVATALLLLNRGLWSPWLVTRFLRIGYAAYLRSIYLRPLAAGVPAALLAAALHSALAPVTSWSKIVFAGVTVALAYYTLAVRLCMLPEHRALVWKSLAQRFRPAPWRS